SAVRRRLRPQCADHGMVHRPLYSGQGDARRLAGLAATRAVARRPAAGAGRDRGLRSAARRGPRLCGAPAEGRHRRRPDRVRRHAARLLELTHAAARRQARYHDDRRRAARGAGAARDVTASAPLPIGGRAVALSGAVIGLGLLGDTLIYAVLPLYHVDWGISLVMVGVLLSLNRWTRLLANSAVAVIGERVGARHLMIAAALGSAVSTTCYGLDGGDALQIAARILWGISFAALNLGSLAYAVADRANAGKRVGAGRGMIGVIQASCFIGGALLVLQIGPRNVFLVLGALTLLAVVAALMLPPLHTEPTDRRGFRLPKPHRLEIWGFLMGFSGDGVFLLTLAFLLKDSVTSVAP